MQTNKTDLDEALELGVLLQLVLHALLSERQVPNIVRVRHAELRGRVQEYVTNTLNHRCLFALAHVYGLEQPTVAFAQVEDIAEDFVYKFVDLDRSNDRRVCRP